MIARCKLADALFRQQDYAGALQNYRAVTDELAGWPRLNTELGGPVRYQGLRASLKQKHSDLAGATNTVEQILKLYPASLLADQSLLLLGQVYADRDEPETARFWLERLAQSSPESPLLPEAELAIACTRGQKSDWPGAITNCDAWLERFPTNALRPNAEYYRAWVNFQAGNETNAFTLFTILWRNIRRMCSRRRRSCGWLTISSAGVTSRTRKRTTSCSFKRGPRPI